MDRMVKNKICVPLGVRPHKSCLLPLILLTKLWWLTNNWKWLQSYFIGNRLAEPTIHHKYSSCHHAIAFILCMLHYLYIHVEVSLEDWKYHLFNVNTVSLMKFIINNQQQFQTNSWVYSTNIKNKYVFTDHLPTFQKYVVCSCKNIHWFTMETHKSH